MLENTFLVDIVNFRKKLGGVISDVTVLRGGSQRICVNSTKKVTMGEERAVKKCSKLRDVIYGQPLK
jgi:hypothetical protein